MSTRAFLILLPFLASCATDAAQLRRSDRYDDLVALFREWRAFERPPLRDGAPDYTAERMRAAHAEWRSYRDRLHAIDPSSWSIPQQVDWHIVRAELNGFDFNCRVLRPWARDPGFYKSVWTYQSDTPAHEGPCNHALVELWTYEFPLVLRPRTSRLERELAVIPPLLAQAREQPDRQRARPLGRRGHGRNFRQQSTCCASSAGGSGRGRERRATRCDPRGAHGDERDGRGG